MTDATILKLNGWPETFNERVVAIHKNLDRTILIRSAPATSTADLKDIDGLTIYDLFPRRTSIISEDWMKLIIFPIHIIQAVALLVYLNYSRELSGPVHALDYGLGGLAGAIVTKVADIDLIVSVRGIKEPRYESLVENRGNVVDRILYYCLQHSVAFVLRSASYIITKSEYQSEYVSKVTGGTVPTSTIPTGVDFDKFSPGSYEHEQLPYDIRMHINQNEYNILYLSTLTPAKGVDKLLELIKTNRERIPQETALLVVGEAHSQEYENHLREVNKAISDMSLLYPKEIPFKKVPTLIHNVDVVVLLSDNKTEGVPRVLQEAYAMETPVVASDVLGIREAFNYLPGCFLIEREDSDQFVESITRIHDCPVGVSTDVAAKRFDMLHNYAKYEEIYSSVYDA